MVAKPSRGSLIRRSSISATIWLIRSASLRALAASMLSVLLVEQPLPSRQQLDLGVPGHQALALGEHAHRVRGCRGHHGHADLGPPVQVQVTGLGHRDAGIAPAQLGDERPDDGTFAFQRVHVAQQHVQGQRRDIHGAWSFARSGVLGPRLLPHLEGLDRVLDAQIAVTDADTALVALADLGRVVLEPPQRVHREVVGDDNAVPDQPRLAVAVDRSGADDAPGDVPDPRDPEHLPDLRRAELDLLELWLEQALERGLDLLDRLVDDRVVPDVHALALGQLARPAGRPDVEADDHRVRGDGQVHVVLGDRADAAADHAQADFLADIQLEQRVLQGLDRAGHVALDDEQQFLALAGLERRL